MQSDKLKSAFEFGAQTYTADVEPNPIREQLWRDMARRFEDDVLKYLGGWTKQSSNIGTAKHAPLDFAKLEAMVAEFDKHKPLVNTTRIIENRYMTKTVYDWSQCRSPSRTKRRMRYNAHRVIKEVPSSDVIATEAGLVMHPQTARTLRANTKPLPYDMERVWL